MSESTSSAASWNDGVIEQFREGKQLIAGMFDRSALLLLGTTGARTGRPRTSPLAYFTDGDRLVIIASAAGQDEHPAWYFNILANPRVSVQVWKGDAIDAFEAIATPAEPEERERLFAQAVAAAPGFGEYQRKTSRVLPVITLQRD